MEKEQGFEEKYEAKAIAVDDAMAAAADSFKDLGVSGVVVIVHHGGKLLFDYRTKTPMVGAALAREAAHVMRMRAKHPEMANNMAETMKIANIDEMLEQMPEEKRAGFRRALENMLQANGRGMRPIATLEGDETVCPGCDEPFRNLGTPHARHEGAGSSQHLECTGCGGQFEKPIKTVDA